MFQRECKIIFFAALLAVLMATGLAAQTTGAGTINGTMPGPPAGE